MKITKEIFDKIPATDFIFAVGIIPNHPEGAYLTSNEGNRGRLLRWVALKTYGGTWKLYAQWTDRSIENIRDCGDKIQTDVYIRRAIDVDDEVFKLYDY